MKLIGKRLGAALLALTLAASTPVLASTHATVDKAPKQTSFERERSEEEWAALRDNVLTWDEIRDLVHEYNPKVSSVWINYRDNNDTGTYDLDYDDVISNIESTYENALGKSDAGDASAELSRMQSLATVDTTIQNSNREVVTLGYEKTEVTTAEAIKQQIITIYTSDLDTRIAELTLNHDKGLLEQAQRKLQVGTGTELDVLTAQKTVKDDEASLKASQAAHIKALQMVLVNLGWTYDANPVICQVPDVTEEMLNAINPDEDIKKAVANSYTLKIDEKKLALAESQSTASSATITMSTDTNQVHSDMTAKYNALVNAENDYVKKQLQERNMLETLDKVTRGFATGANSQREVETAQFNYDIAKINTELAQYAIKAAYFTYISYRDGLAGSSSTG